MPEPACRHTGAPWGRRDIHLPPRWTRAVQTCLPSDDHAAARSLPGQCGLKLALRDKTESYRFPPRPPRDMTTVKGLEVLPIARAWSGPQQTGRSPSLSAGWDVCISFHQHSVPLSWQKSTAMRETPLPWPLPQPAPKTQRNTDRLLRHTFNSRRNPKEPHHQI